MARLSRKKVEQLKALPNGVIVRFKKNKDGFISFSMCKRPELHFIVNRQEGDDCVLVREKFSLEEFVSLSKYLGDLPSRGE